MLNPFRRGSDPQLLVVGMTGVKLGERFAQIGCAHGGRLGAVAAKVGLSGRAVAIVPDEASGARARKGAADAGVLVEVETAPPTDLPLEDDAFDLVVIDDTGDFFATWPPARAERPCAKHCGSCGRADELMVDRTRRSGGARRAALPCVVRGPAFDAAPALEAGGFRAVRTLAEREGLVFVEGIKPRTP